MIRVLPIRRRPLRLIRRLDLRHRVPYGLRMNISHILVRLAPRLPGRQEVLLLDLVLRLMMMTILLQRLVKISIG